MSHPPIDYNKFYYKVIDNVLSKKEKLDVINLYRDNKIPMYDTWYNHGDLEFVDRMLEFYFDWDVTILGYEAHFNDKRLHPHYDKDEEYFRRYGKMIHPIISMIYYPYFDGEGHGGDLVIINEHEGEKIQHNIPVISNRLVFFTPNALHGVEYYDEEKYQRLSIGINPWSYKPLAYTDDVIQEIDDAIQ